MAGRPSLVAHPGVGDRGRMRLSDVLEKEVVDQSGRSWGQVHDALLRQDGDVMTSGRRSYRLHGLLVGRASFSSRLGYAKRPEYGEESATRGPWLVKALARWLSRHAVYVPWDAVDRVEDRRVVVRAPQSGFDHAG